MRRFVPCGMQEPECLQLVNRTYARLAGRKLSYFSGCDYFRLSSHSQVVRAVTAGLEKFGLSVSASRRTTGNHALYGELESALASFFRAEAATLVPTGYLAGIAAVQGLRGSVSHAFIDERAHPALCDAALELKCPVARFEHRDAGALKRVLEKIRPDSKPAVLTDGLFASDGSVAPLDGYLRCLPRNGLLLVDDAHGAGILGARGGGTVEHFNAFDRRVIQLITLSKAFGTYAGAILGPTELRKLIIERSTTYIGSTPLPLPLANAALKAIQILKKHGTVYRKRLASNLLFVRSGLRQSGIPVSDFPGPIVPVQTRRPAALKKHLLKAGIYPPLISYPGAPASGFFRFVISSEHTEKQLADLVDALSTAREWI
jgi:8-amino-7-oxononanoate synthase